jgi:hypothetical protein
MEQEVEYINEERKGKGLLPVEWDAVEWDYSGYTNTVSRMVADDVTEALLALGVIHSGIFQKPRSPREYNFANDSIDVRFTFMAKNIKKIAAYLEEYNEAFSEYLLERYTSRDGFTSFHSASVDAWSGDLLGDTMADGHKAGAVLNFILLNENGPEYEWKIYEHVRGNGANITAKNYQALVTGGK